MAHHDSSYKSLFSHQRMVQDLITGFVREDWIKYLDFSTLEKQNNSYTSDDLRERSDDIIWRLRFKDQWLYLYILLEFQSTPDSFMAVRVMSYIGLLYQDLIKAGHLEEISDQQGTTRLPPVLPIVLYNGRRAWHSHTSIQDIIHPMPEGLCQYQPQLTYLLIDESQYNDSELKSLSNLVAELFRLENSETPEQISQILSSLIEWLRHPKQQTLERAFVEWLNRHRPSHISHNEAVEPFESLLDWRKSMLAETMQKWTEQWTEDGIEKGQQIERTHIAINLMDILDDEEIAKRTGLDIDAVKALRAGLV